MAENVYTVQEESLVSIANAIRNKAGKNNNEKLAFPEGFIDTIGEITGGDSQFSGIRLYSDIIKLSSKDTSEIYVSYGSIIKNYYYKKDSNLYSPSYFIGGEAVRDDSNSNLTTYATIQESDIKEISENGSFTVGGIFSNSTATQQVSEFLVSVHDSDLNQTLHLNSADLVFKESGIYILKNQFLYYDIDFKNIKAIISEDMPIWQGGTY